MVLLSVSLSLKSEGLYSPITTIELVEGKVKSSQVEQIALYESVNTYFICAAFVRFSLVSLCQELVHALDYSVLDQFLLSSPYNKISLDERKMFKRVRSNDL